MSEQNINLCFLGMLFSGGQGFFLPVKDAGQAMGVSVHYDACPAEPRGSCSEHSKSLSWFVCHGVACRLAEPSTCMENSTFFRHFSVARSALTFI